MLVKENHPAFPSPSAKPNDFTDAGELSGVWSAAQNPFFAEWYREDELVIVPAVQRHFERSNPSRNQPLERFRNSDPWDAINRQPRSASARFAQARQIRRQPVRQVHCCRRDTVSCEPQGQLDSYPGIEVRPQYRRPRITNLRLSFLRGLSWSHSMIHGEPWNLRP